MSVLISPNKVTLFITRQCNLDCRHCFSESGKCQKNELTFSEIRELSNTLEDMGIFKLTISGGEPFIRHDILNILETFMDKNFDTVVASNGTLISNRVIDFLEEYQIPIQISIDSDNHSLHDKFRGIEGAFKETVDGIKKLSKRNIDFSLGVTITVYNYDRLEQIVNFGKNLGAKGIYFMFFVPVGRGITFQTLDAVNDYYKKIISDLIDIKEKENDFWIAFPILFPFKSIFSSDPNIFGLGLCEAGVSRCAIDSNGDVYPCQLLMKRQFKAGNIRDSPFMKIWRDSPTFKYLRGLTTDDLVGVCDTCDIKNICRGGCRGAAFQTSGGLLTPDPRCPKFSKVDNE